MQLKNHINIKNKTTEDRENISLSFVIMNDKGTIILAYSVLS